MSDEPDITSSVSDCAMAPKIFEDKVDPDAPDESEESVIKFGIQDLSKSSASPPQSSISALGVKKCGVISWKFLIKYYEYSLDYLITIMNQLTINALT